MILSIENVASIGSCLFNESLILSLDLHFKPNYTIDVSEVAFDCFNNISILQLNFTCSIDSDDVYSFSTHLNMCGLVDTSPHLYFLPNQFPSSIPIHVIVRGDKCLPLLGSFKCLKDMIKVIGQQIHIFMINAGIFIALVIGIRIYWFSNTLQKNLPQKLPAQQSFY